MQRCRHLPQSTSCRVRRTLTLKHSKAMPAREIPIIRQCDCIVVLVRIHHSTVLTCRRRPLTINAWQLFATSPKAAVLSCNELCLVAIIHTCTSTRIMSTCISSLPTSPSTLPPHKGKTSRVSFALLQVQVPSSTLPKKRTLGSIYSTFLALLVIYIAAAISVFVVRNKVTLRDAAELAQKAWMLEDPQSRSMTTLKVQLQLPRPSSASSSAEPSIMFVHVGKTGGTSIGSMLRVFCESRHKKDSQDYCLQEWKQRHHLHLQGNATSTSTSTTTTTTSYPESRLSQYTRGFVHVDWVYPTADATTTATHYLISLRHPVERVISWYYYLHPINCHQVNGIPTPRQAKYSLIDKACITRRRILRSSSPQNREHQFYKRCFPTLEPFARALFWMLGNNHTDDCQQLAVETLHGHGGPSGMAGHLWANHSYYYQRYLSLLVPSKPILAVRTEHLWQDLAEIEEQQLSLGAPLLMGEVFRQQRDQEQQQPSWMQPPPQQHYYRDGKLSSEGYAALCCALYDEFQVYQQLLQSAINLDPNDKATTLRDAFQKCHATIYTLADLQQYCTILPRQASDSEPAMGKMEQ
jgi:Sulfotransferase family